MAENNTGLQLLRKTQDQVLKSVLEYKTAGELVFPERYSPENAIKAGMLSIQEAKDRNGKPAIDVCTQASVYYALLNMAIMGLNPMKGQCYFIVRGQKLCCDPSYFGMAAVAKRVDENVEDFPAQIVYEGDEFEYEKRDGYDYVISHKQNLANINKDKIVAAYCVVRRYNGDNYAHIMTMDEIKAAWLKSPVKPVDSNGNIKAGSTHAEYTAQMAKRTVIKSAAWAIVKKSDDSNLLVKTVKQNQAGLYEADAEAEIQENENSGEFLEVEYEELPVDEAPAPANEPAAEAEPQPENTAKAEKPPAPPF